LICDGGPDQTQAQRNRALLRAGDSFIYPQARGAERYPQHQNSLR
jgi:hypothetical protein